MKTREDFVSNSSSSSFIIKDLDKFIDAFEELSGNDLWWLYGLSITFEIDNTRENKERFKPLIDAYSMNDERSQTLYVNADFEQLLSINKEDYGFIKNLSVYAYNDSGYDATDMLTLLYWAMRSKNVDVTDKDSERELALFSNVPTKIINAAMKMF